MIGEGKGEMTLRSVLTIRHLSYVNPDHPLDVGLRYMDRWPILPVVSRADFRQLEGVLTKDRRKPRPQRVAAPLRW